MKTIKKDRRSPSQSFQYRLILSYTFILVLILVAAIILFQVSYQQLKDGRDTQDATMLSSSIRRLDDTMYAISKAARQISANSVLTALTGSSPAGDDSFYYLAYQAQQELKPDFSLNQALAVSDSFIYMENSGYIISPSLFLPFDSYARYKLLFTPDMAESLEARFHIQSDRNRFISLTEFDGGKSGYLYFYPIAGGSVFAEKSIQSYLCCIFEQDLMEYYFTGLGHEGTSIIAADPAGNRKLALIKDGDSAGPSIQTAVCESEYNNWQYTLWQPKEQAYYSMNRYRNLFISITMLALVLEGMMVYYFSAINSRPVMQLANDLVMKEEQASSLGNLLEKHRPLVHESYMRRIMEGDITTADEMDYIAGELHLNRSGIRYQVLCMEVYPSENDSIQLDDMPLCLQNFDVLVRDALRRHFPDTGYIYKPSNRLFAVLLAAPEALSHQQVMLGRREAFAALHTELLSQFGIWSRGGFGGSNAKIANTWKSYQQAKDAKSITTAEHYLRSYQDFITSDDTYYYPEIMSVQLTGAISTGNKKQVMELFRLIAKENIEIRSLPPAQRQQLLFDIRSTLFKKRHSLLLPAGSESDSPDSRSGKLLDRIDREFEQEMSLDGLQNIALELSGFYVRKNNHHELIIKIQDYINQNYHDPSLCLTKTSEEFNISENYFSFLFKKAVHENFSGYLEKLRMAKAKELVQNSDTGLSDLYQYLGYSNAASFRRVFKKTFGISPKEMREHKNG